MTRTLAVVGLCLAELVIGILALTIRAPRAPVLIWNATASAPEGLYRLQAARPWKAGDLVAVRPPTGLATWLDARGYVPSGVLLIKQAAALAPARVCRIGDRITINSAPVAKVRAQDRLSRTLPVWAGCRILTRDEVFLLNDAEASLDSRYFGPVNRSAVVGKLTPLWLVPEDRHGR
ncbi:MAG: hypothetical protein CFE28_10800 [Alphaproteobacteria bacterium PA2]|nr:MAG: hypothetical protein CFE28_10800 [Alphaproteobacteria bacterium PA2]